MITRRRPRGRHTAPSRRRAVAAAAGLVQVGDVVVRDPVRSGRTLVHGVAGRDPS